MNTMKMTEYISGYLFGAGLSVLLGFGADRAFVGLAFAMPLGWWLYRGETR